MSEEAIKELEELEAEPLEADNANDEAADDNQEAEQEEVSITFGDDKPEEEEKHDTDLVRHLRKTNREQAKAIKEFKKANVKTDDETPLGARPTFEGSDYDEDKFSDALSEWNDSKRKFESSEKEEEDKKIKDQESFDAKGNAYTEAKKAFNQDEFEEAEAAVKSKLSETQVKILIHSFGDGTAKLVAGLGSNPKRLEELSKITDHILFAVAAQKLESSMKMTPKRTPKNVPESKLGGNSSSSAGANIEKLKEQAQNTGNYTAYYAAKREQKKG